MTSRVHSHPLSAGLPVFLGAHITCPRWPGARQSGPTPLTRPNETVPLHVYERWQTPKDDRAATFAPGCAGGGGACGDGGGDGSGGRSDFARRGNRLTTNNSSWSTTTPSGDGAGGWILIVRWSRNCHPASRRQASTDLTRACASACLRFCAARRPVPEGTATPRQFRNHLQSGPPTEAAKPPR
jgi:hypothetical protein